jgi:hypothetical protein
MAGLNRRGIQKFSGKTLGKYSLAGLRRWEENIKMYVMEIGLMTRGG